MAVGNAYYDGLWRANCLIMVIRAPPKKVVSCPAKGRNYGQFGGPKFFPFVLKKSTYIFEFLFCCCKKKGKKSFPVGKNILNQAFDWKQIFLRLA